MAPANAVTPFLKAPSRTSCLARLHFVPARRGRACPRPAATWASRRVSRASNLDSFSGAALGAAASAWKRTVTKNIMTFSSGEISKLYLVSRDSQRAASHCIGNPSYLMGGWPASLADQRTPLSQDPASSHSLCAKGWHPSVATRNTRSATDLRRPICALGTSCSAQWSHLQSNLSYPPRRPAQPGSSTDQRKGRPQGGRLGWDKTSDAQRQDFLFKYQRPDLFLGALSHCLWVFKEKIF